MFTVRCIECGNNATVQRDSDFNYTVYCEACDREEYLSIFELAESYGGTDILDELDTCARHIASNIRRWDRENIITLLNMLRELRHVCELLHVDIDRYVDIAFLPSEEIPDSIVTYPVWAMDRMGYCLAGENADTVRHVSTFRYNMEGWFR